MCSRTERRSAMAKRPKAKVRLAMLIMGKGKKGKK
jgi:hypothetical protein